MVNKRQLKNKTNKYYPQWLRETKLPRTRMEGRLYIKKSNSNYSRMSKQEPNRYKQHLEIRKILIDGLMELV